MGLDGDDIADMFFVMKLGHDSEFMEKPEQDSVPGRDSAPVCCSKGMRSSYREAMAMHRCQGPHTCKGLGMVLLPVPALASTPVAGQAAAVTARELAKEDFKLLHKQDRLPGLKDPSRRPAPVPPCK